MAGVKFIPEVRKDRTGDYIVKNVPIFLHYSFNGKRLVYYTGERINKSDFIPQYWKANKDPIKKTASGSERINRNLSTLKLHIENLHSDAKALGIVPDVEYFRTNLHKRIKGVPSDRTVTVLGAFREYVEDVRELNEYNTYKAANTLFNHFCDFAGNKRLQFSDIDNDLIDSFRKYLAKGRLNNTVAKNLSILRTFLKTWCKKRGYYNNDELQIKAKENDIEVIFLNYDEIIRLQGITFTEEQIAAVKQAYSSIKDISVSPATLDRVRDVFVFGCFTGMRFSDIAKLRKSDIQDAQVRFYIKKGGYTTSHTVPLIDETRQILNKYKSMPGDQALPVISNQKMNNYLKVIGKIADFNEIITLAKKQGNGKIKEVQYPKHELISCHTSRKSFITVALTRGMKEHEVKSITGHSKDSKAFSRYYEVIDSHKQNIMTKIFENESV